MAVTILYFAWVRERIGAGSETLELPAGVETAGALAEWLAGRSAAHAAAFADRDRLRVAVDQAFADWDARVSQAREVAFFPPVTGG